MNELENLQLISCSWNNSKFEALTQQVSGSIGEMKKTNTAKFEVMLLKPHQLSSTPEKLKPSSA